MMIKIEVVRVLVGILLIYEHFGMIVFNEGPAAPCTPPPELSCQQKLTSQIKRSIRSLNLVCVKVGPS